MSTQVTQASEWRRGESVQKELSLPSGKVCLVKRPDSMEVFLSRGMVPNSLMPLIEKAITEGQGGKVIDATEVMKEVTKDPAKIKSMFDLVDAVVVDVVLSPKVMAVPFWTDEDLQAGRCQPTEVGQMITDDRRPEGDFVWIDWVDIPDRMFIFNFAVGGTKNLETFREQQAHALASLEPEQGVEVPTE